MAMNPIDRELLKRYLSDEVTPDERMRVEAWLAEDPDRWAKVAELQEGLAQGALSEPAIEAAKAEVWERLEGEVGRVPDPIRARRPSATPRAFVPSLRSSWRTRAPLAASLVLALVGGTGIGILLLRGRPPERAAAERVASTAAGQRAMFRLPDGTRVMLGVASMLRYPPAFPSGRREVSLEGEAYFEVVHDERRPFAVRAGDLMATDLGTEFTVRAYPDDKAAHVVVRQGRVAVRAVTRSATRVVAPGQLGRIGEDDLISVEAADTAVWFAWTRGRLVFDGTPLREALPQLSRWFDLDFRLADSAAGEVPLTATLRMEPTAEALDNLAASLGLRQQRLGKIVTLYSTSR